MNVTPTNIIIF